MTDPARRVRVGCGYTMKQSANLAAGATNASMNATVHATYIRGPLCGHRDGCLVEGDLAGGLASTGGAVGQPGWPGRLRRHGLREADAPCLRPRQCSLCVTQATAGSLSLRRAWLSTLRIVFGLVSAFALLAAVLVAEEIGCCTRNDQREPKPASWGGGQSCVLATRKHDKLEGRRHDADRTAR